MIRIGIDIGSTTAKVIVLDEKGKLLFSRYERHNAQANATVTHMLKLALRTLGDIEANVKVTGSVGMGFAERYAFPFVQEVVAAAKAIQRNYPQTASMIDIGGEDAKIVFFRNGKASELRMNGNCAGGTGAFIDQMAVILGVNVQELNELALQSTQIYPIASRCGVFCKTDIQNLIAKNVRKEDIAASIFHAVAVQTVVTLAHGCDIASPVLFCGGPLSFIPALRKAFINYLSVREQDIIVPENGAILPALGTALSDSDNDISYRLSSLISRLEEKTGNKSPQSHLKPIFSTEEEYEEWQVRMSACKVEASELKPGRQNAFIGIDSGSTTTKIVVTDECARILYSYYAPNGGNPIEAVEKGLNLLKEKCAQANAELQIKGSCATGYGEDLIKAAFQLDAGIVETMAHYKAAHYLNKDVSFILDIGGQDMKAIFISQGTIDRIEINEACSSGCGSFIETFARTLGFTAHEFSTAACHSLSPYDLGTRCTVFMNSKVKQALREGAAIEDIAAGLAYSVIKNCLYKVLKLKDTSALGKHIVVQGGTMRNDAVVRALEVLIDTEVTRCNIPELMGAFGCALHAITCQGAETELDNLISKAHYTSRLLHCKGCSNQCPVVRYHFDNGTNYYSGNRCEKVFTNENIRKKPGANLYQEKNELLFSRCNTKAGACKLTIGIPRCLNMYEDFPFWHSLFTACGIQVVLSAPSNFRHYEHNARLVMSDNICFPAKLVHSHIQDLIEKKVDRIFMPYVVFERNDKGQNSYNCPIVTGYSDVIKSVQASDIPIDTPAVTFKHDELLLKQCSIYLKSLGLNMDDKTIRQAFAKAKNEQELFGKTLAERCREALRQAEQEERLVILLAGRPYHTDPLIQHKVAQIISDMGIDVITEDIIRDTDIDINDKSIHFLSQWAYPNRILKAAKWCSMQNSRIQFVEMTSFGCGPDAFLSDEVRDLLIRHGKALTLLKLDDINNVGSMKLRIRSLVESLNAAIKADRLHKATAQTMPATAPEENNWLQRKIIVPYFTPFLSPLIPAIMRCAGYDVENLPLSNQASCDWGLKYANNEVCYPATLIVGDVVRAFKENRYDPGNTIVALTQTGGQCRASNYIPLIKKALADAGYAQTPVVSLTFGNSINDGQPNLKINWLKILPIALRSILYSDCISKFYYASAAREKEPGLAADLKDYYLKTARQMIAEGHSDKLFALLAEAAGKFNGICRKVNCRKVGIVGEIFLKFNPFAQKNIIGWLTERGAEVVPPIMTDFFTQSFVNVNVRIASHIDKKEMPAFIYKLGYSLVKREIKKVNGIAGKFRYYIPFKDIFDEAEEARKIVSLNAQFGEGWLLPAEIMSYANQGIQNVISLQPFGCIANHIVSKGIEIRIKHFYPDINLLSLDFDSGVSDVNVTNRMLLFIDNLK